MFQVVLSIILFEFWERKPILSPLCPMRVSIVMVFVSAKKERVVGDISVNP